MLCHISHNSLASQLKEQERENTQVKTVMKKRQVNQDRYMPVKKIRNQRCTVYIRTKNASLQDKTQDKNYELKRVRSRESYQEERRTKSNELNGKLKDQMEILECEKEELIVRNKIFEHQCKILKEENDNLNILLEECQNENIETKVDGRYMTDIQKCIYKLLECQVSTTNIEGVLTAMVYNRSTTNSWKTPTMYA